MNSTAAPVLCNIALSPAETGSLLIAMDSRTRDIEIDPAKFDAYLAEEGLTAVRAARGASAAPGKERYSRNLKAILASGRPGGAIATAVVGQELEIVPAVDPLTLPEGGTLPLIIHFRGQPLADAQVMVANRVPTGTIRTWIQRTDSAGRVSFVVSGPGEWIARLVHMLPSTEPDVDWRSWWASLTFER